MALLRALVLCLVFPVQAQALSCLPWHVEDAFLEADASPDSYVVVTGTLDFEPSDLPQVDWRRQEEIPPETRLDARLTGTALGRSGTSAPFDAPVQLIVECAGPWCPQLRADADYLAFVNTADDPFVLRTGACGGMIFRNPGTEILARLQECLDGAACTPPPR